jgi:hypothetical protein
VRFAEFEAPDETAAVALAKSYRNGQPMELWCRHRKVAIFDGAGMTAASGAAPSRPAPGSSANAGGALDKPIRA